MLYEFDKDIFIPLKNSCGYVRQCLCTEEQGYRDQWQDKGNSEAEVGRAQPSPALSRERQPWPISVARVP